MGYMISVVATLLGLDVFFIVAVFLITNKLDIIIDKLDDIERLYRDLEEKIEQLEYRLRR